MSLEKSRKFPISWVGNGQRQRIVGANNMTGIVKNIVVKKGFGFIMDPVTRTEYFFHKDDFNGHWDDLVNDWNNKEEVSVEFEVTPSPKGPRASKVRRTDFPNQAV
jgi:cold shock CspA family protein